jgi:uncharacterized protein YndB with AHSA1/START domain
MSGTHTHRRHETELVVDPAIPTIVVTREFEAPPARVFRAWTDPELVVRWLGPRDLTLRIDQLDARTGGTYRYCHSDGTEEYGFYGVFHEVRPDERIVQTFSFDGAPDEVMLETIVFEDLGGRTRVVSTSVSDSLAARDQAVAAGMEHGVRESYERLDEVLAD